MINDIIYKVLFIMLVWLLNEIEHSKLVIVTKYCAHNQDISLSLLASVHL